ncbi:cytochrome P450 [Nocardia xishanensis]|uniref:cytochrome P450 n=1 Tax=Nocardia xishanensis TaxID=238964 RepID=UPI00082E2B07|nr:cytochrome P450 [Nocardia xishanensis]
MAVRTPSTTESRAPLPHPRWRLPVFGDLLTTDPIKPTQMSMRDAQALGPIFERRIMDWPMIVVSGADLIAEINDEKNWTKHVGVLFKKIRPVARDGLFTAYNSEPNWQKAHNILAPSFTKEAMIGYHDTMNAVAGDLIAYWASRRGQWVDVAEDMNRFTLEVISKCGFDFTFDSFTREKTHPFVATMLRGLRYINSNANLPPIIQKTVGRSASIQHKRDIAYVHEVVDEIIATRKSSGTVGEHSDLLDRMLTVPDPETGETLDDLNIRNQILTFLVAGHETSAGVLAFALYEIARNPGIAARAREELAERFPGQSHLTIAFDDVAKLRYIRRIVDETLRLWPVAPGYFREARHDVVIGDGRYHFKAGEWVLVLTLQAHRDKTVWGEDAEKFDPDRWLPGRQRDQRAYKPFGTGLRACIGRQFAYHEVMLALAHLLREFDFEHDPGYKLDIKEQITLKPSGFKLRLSPRSS